MYILYAYLLYYMATYVNHTQIGDTIYTVYTIYILGDYNW